MCVELISLFFLLVLRLYNFSYFKITNNEPIIVFFSKKHLPHPLVRKSFSKENDLSNNNLEKYDPNSVLYNHRLDRFGNQKKITLKNQKKEYFNIFLIGGSTVEGDGVYSSSDTIDAAIRYKINELQCSNKINVFNEGISGNSSKQDFLNISLRILPHYYPDMIVSLQGWNDFLAYAGTRYNDISPLAKYWTSREQKTYNYINSQKLNKKIVIFLKNETYLGILLSSMLQTFKKYFDSDLEYKIELSKSENLEILKKNYFYFQDQSQKISKYNNVLYFHFLQPSLLYKRFPTDYEKNILGGVKNTYSYSGRNNDIYSKNYWKNLEIFYDGIIKDIENEKKEWLFDFSNIFRDSLDNDFVDHGHLSKIGQKKIGVYIFDKIKDSIICNN